MTVRIDEVRADAISLAHPLRDERALESLVDAARSRRVIAIGEASHGTHEFYQWRAHLTRRLIEDRGTTWIGVEGDWPDCWRIDRWVRDLADQDLDARGVLAGFDRWPTWMWANSVVADFLDWLRAHNRTKPADGRTGFYGLDVYSLWDSLARTMSWLEVHAPASLPVAMTAWRCFAPFDEDPQRYAWETRLVPYSCENDVVEMLAEVRRLSAADGDDAFDAMQNALVVERAERYYRAMVRTDRGSWNIRDVYMADTVDRLAAHCGPGSTAIIWAHNTHVGDARATSMSDAGLLNLGQLLRERYGSEQVMLIGMASHRGEVTAATRWGSVEQRIPVPPARDDSYEGVLHHTLGEAAVLTFGDDRDRPFLALRAGHRAIGVVYDPANERANDVSTIMGQRYDALLWLEETSALRPLHHEAAPEEQEFETAPSGF